MIKKLFLLTAILFFMESHTIAQQITGVSISPAQSSYTTGTSVTIYWEFNEIDPDEPVKITLWKENSTRNNCLIIADLPIRTGTTGFRWNIPSTCINPHTGVEENLTEGRVKIRVRWQRHPVFRESQWFTIERPAVITTGDVWLEPGKRVYSPGETVLIKWSFASSAPPSTVNNAVRITLRREGITQSICRIADNVPASMSTTGYSWTIPRTCPNPRTGNPEDLTHGNLNIRVRLKNTPEIAETRSPFTVNANSFELTAPSHGAEITEGERLTFSWRYSDSSESFTIYLKKITATSSNPNINQYCSIKIAEHQPATGSFVWNAGDSISTNCRNIEGNYSVEFRGETSGYTWNSPWELTVHAIKQIIIIHPQEGETYYGGDTLNIKWHSKGDISRVTITILQSLLFLRLTSPLGIKNRGAFDWDIPYNFRPGNYKIKIADAKDNSVYAVTDYISIKQPKLKLLLPNSSTQCNVNYHCDIRWHTEGLKGKKMKIEIIETGRNLNPIVFENISNSGHFTWRPNYTGKYRVKISTMDGAISDTGKEFMVKNPSRPHLNITSPVIARTFYNGSVVNIRWKKTGPMVPFVKIELLDEQNNLVKTIERETQNDEAYNWVVRNVPEGRYKIRVSTVDGRHQDNSVVFSIKVPAVKLIEPSPNSTSIYKTGQNIYFTLTYEGPGKAYIRVELKKNNGTIRRIIRYSVMVRNGTFENFSWKIPGNLPVGVYTIVASAGGATPSTARIKIIKNH